MIKENVGDKLVTVKVHLLFRQFPVDLIKLMDRWIKKIGSYEMWTWAASVFACSIKLENGLRSVLPK